MLPFEHILRRQQRLRVAKLGLPAVSHCFLPRRSQLVVLVVQLVVRLLVLARESLVPVRVRRVRQ